MPIDPEALRTGGALQGGVAASLLRQRERASELARGAAVGPYRVVRELGRGGMAIVYLAERADGEYEQQVALKWMQRAQADEAGAELFRRERQALADLRHPHIARLIDGGRSEDGRPWLAMDLVDGERLDRHCVRESLPLRERLALFLQVCAAVAHAHARGLIHRDINPSNVLVERAGGARRRDIGIAQLLGRDDGLASGAFTPGFASPEQVRGEAVTVAGDVYQLGRLLASLACDDEEQQATLVAQATLATADAAGSTALPENLPRDLAAIVRKASAMDPAARYATADALADDVRAFLERRPVRALPRRPGYVAARYLQRHPLGVALAALALAVLVGGAALFTWKLRAERDIATYQAHAATSVLEFLNDDLFDAANPSNRAPDAPDMSVREALRIAESHVEQRFAQQPAIAARVLTTFADLRYQFGDFDVALGLLDRAIGLAGVQRDSVEGLRARAERGMILTTTNHFEDAEAVLKGVVADAERTLGRDHRDTLEYTLRLLENAERRNPDMSEAADLAALRARADAALGQPNAISGEADYLIADDARLIGAPLRAAAEARRAVAALSATRGADNPATLKAKVTLAFVEQAEGHADDALATLRAAHHAQAARYGPDVLDALFMQNELGMQLVYARHYDEAADVFSDLLARRERVQGMQSAQLIPSLVNLGTIRMRQGRPADALVSFDRSVEIIAATPDTPRYMMASARRAQADALRELGRHDEARAALDAGDAAAAELGENDLRRLGLRGVRARLLIAQGDVAQGIEQLDAVIAAMRAQVDEQHPSLAPLLAARVAAGAR
jgi:tetratricopeptide (TPR) repeat protein/tRNA A-37 threonylcarbamoyl transferase component Bud32